MTHSYNVNQAHLREIGGAPPAPNVSHRLRSPTPTVRGLEQNARRRVRTACQGRASGATTQVDRCRSACPAVHVDCLDTLAAVGACRKHVRARLCCSPTLPRIAAFRTQKPGVWHAVYLAGAVPRTRETKGLALLPFPQAELVSPSCDTLASRGR